MKYILERNKDDDDNTSVSSGGKEEVSENEVMEPCLNNTDWMEVERAFSLAKCCYGMELITGKKSG